MKILELIRRYPVHTYFFTVFLISWMGSLMVAGPSFLRGEDISAANLLLILIFMLAGPVIAGTLLIYLVDGKSGLQDLFSRMWLWKTNFKWYGFALFIPLVLILITLCALSVIISPSFKPGFLVVGIIYGLLAGYFEEIGWMGYAYPKMEESLGPLKGAIILGLLWGIWHVVAGFLGSFERLGAYWLPNFLSLWIVGMTAMRILIVWIYQNTQSILLCQLIHASSTGFLAVLSPVSVTPAQETLWYSIYSGLLWITVLVILLVYGKTLTKKNFNTGRR